MNECALRPSEVQLLARLMASWRHLTVLRRVGRSQTLQLTLFSDVKLIGRNTMNQRAIGAIALLLLPVISLTFDANGALPPTEMTQTGAASTSTLKPGEAKGTLTAGGQSVELKFAYAHMTKGHDDLTKQEIEVLLTNQPIPKESLLKGDDFRDALFFAQDNVGLCLRVSREGKVVYLSLKMRIVRQSQQISLNQQSQVLAVGVVKIDAGSIEGKSEQQAESSGEKWSYEVAFRAPIMKQGRARK